MLLQGECIKQQYKLGTKDMTAKSLSSSSLFASILLLSSSIFTASQAAQPPFDCSKVWQADQRAICADENLSKTDQLLNFGFNYLKQNAGKQVATKLARDFLSDRQACFADRNCIRDASGKALQAFKKAGAPVEVPNWIVVEQSKETSDNGDNNISEAKIEASEATTTPFAVKQPIAPSADVAQNTATPAVNSQIQVTQTSTQQLKTCTPRAGTGDPIAIATNLGVQSGKAMFCGYKLEAAQMVGLAAKAIRELSNDSEQDSDATGQFMSSMDLAQRLGPQGETCEDFKVGLDGSLDILKSKYGG